MDHQEKLEMEQFLEAHPMADDIVQFFILFGIVILLPFVWLKDKIHELVG